MLQTQSITPICSPHHLYLFHIGVASEQFARRLSGVPHRQAAYEVLRKVSNTPDGPGAYKVAFASSALWHKGALEPVLAAFQAITWDTDLKFGALGKLLQEILENWRKVIIFSERLPTVVYLDEGLGQAFPDLASIACTVTRTAHNRLQNVCLIWGSPRSSSVARQTYRTGPSDPGHNPNSDKGGTTRCLAPAAGQSDSRGR